MAIQITPPNLFCFDIQEAVQSAYEFSDPFKDTLETQINFFYKQRAGRLELAARELWNNGKPYAIEKCFVTIPQIRKHQMFGRVQTLRNAITHEGPEEKIWRFLFECRFKFHEIIQLHEFNLLIEDFDFISLMERCAKLRIKYSQFDPDWSSLRGKTFYLLLHGIQVSQKKGLSDLMFTEHRPEKWPHLIKWPLILGVHDPLVPRAWIPSLRQAWDEWRKADNAEKAARSIEGKKRGPDGKFMAARAADGGFLASHGHEATHSEAKTEKIPKK